MKVSILFVLIILFPVASVSLDAEIRYIEDPPSPDLLFYIGNVNFFYSVLCPVCHEEINYLEKLESLYPDMVFNLFEVKKTKHERNRELLKKFAEAYFSLPNGVPRTFIGDLAFFGYDETDGELNFSQIYKANIGHRNQILIAVEQLAANTAHQIFSSLLSTVALPCLKASNTPLAHAGCLRFAG